VNNIDTPRRAAAVAAAMFLLAAACQDDHATAPPANDAGAPIDARGEDRQGSDGGPAAPPVADARGAVDSTSQDAADARMASDAATAGPGACTRPPPDQPWIRDYQDNLVATLAGARALPGGGSLPNRQTPANRTAARQFLLDQFGQIGLTGQVHDYGSGQNVYAVLASTDGSREYVVLGAHFDSVRGCPGANDNATGVAAVYAAARYLGTLPCRSRNVLFVLFDQEEDGLVGSRAFARKLKGDGLTVHSVHTIDQLGWDSDGDRRIEAELPDKGLRELYIAAATDLGRSDPAGAVVATNTASTDHASFRPDFPAIGLTEEYRGGDTTPHYHRPTDTYPTVNLDFLKSSTVLIHHVFADLIAPTPRFAHRLPRPEVVLRSPDEIDTRSRRFTFASQAVRAGPPVDGESSRRRGR
jgi:hypothetical protein